MHIRIEDAQYLMRAVEMIDSGEFDGMESFEAEDQTIFLSICAECNQQIDRWESDGHSIAVRNGRVIVMIACEGYHQLRDAFDDLKIS